ncbi:hypothetical protein D3C77_727870 [compost metagenome]
MLEIVKPVEHGIQAKIDRAHVQRSDLRLELQRWLQTFLHQHIGGAAGGEIDHHIRASPNVGEKLHE